LSGAVVAIGNFDGVHRGHQHLVQVAMDQAGRTAKPSAILTFDPHPRAFFAPQGTRFTLTPGPVKLRVLEALGINGVFVWPFDEAVARTTASEFVATLAQETGASGLVVGENFHFGRGREGTPEMLRELAARQGLACEIVGIVDHAEEPVSSSRIRRALTEGDVAGANGSLGYRWFVIGKVVHGAKLGRTLGYPTANLELEPGTDLRHGVYAVRAALGAGEIRGGVASFGRRPTFDNGRPLLEVFLFDISVDLYDRDIAVEFVSWIRGEEKFESAAALVAQMDADVQAARKLLAAPSSPRSCR
jgi:riboflavin kinase/FMN adenylyltransferase